MKKVISLILMLLIILCIANSVSAANSFQMDMIAAKEEFQKGEEFTVEAKITNLKTDNGIISFSARLGYNKNDLELVKMEGKNNWEAPIEETNSFNPKTGKMAINRSGLGKSDETVFVVTFKVKADKINIKDIKLTEISASGGDGLIKANDITARIIPMQSEDDKPNGGNTGDNGNQSGNQTGDNQSSGGNTGTNAGSNSGNNNGNNSGNAGTNSGNNSSGNNGGNSVDKGNNSGSKVENLVTDKTLPQTGVNTGMFFTIAAGLVVIIMIAIIGIYKAKRIQIRK